MSYLRLSKEKRLKTFQRSLKYIVGLFLLKKIDFEVLRAINDLCSLDYCHFLFGKTYHSVNYYEQIDGCTKIQTKK